MNADGLGKSVSTSALKETFVGNFEVEGKDRPPFNLDEYVEWSTHHSCGGTLGSYQTKALWMLSSVWLFVGIITYNFNFITKEPDVGEISGRRLILPDNVTTCTQEEIGLYGDACPELPFDLCDIDRELWEYREPENSVRASFDLSECTPRKYVIATIGTLWWVTASFGVFSAGVFSDKFGRKPTWYIYLTIQTVGVALMAMSTNYFMFGAARVLQAFGAGGFDIVGFVYCTEGVNSESKHYLAWIPNIWWITGGCLPAVMSYGFAIYDWRSYQWCILLCHIPGFLVPLMFFESPKYLATTQLRTKIHEVMSGICAQNGKPAPPPPPESDYVKTVSKLTLDGPKEQQWDKYSQDEGFASLLHPKVLKKLVITGAGWMTISMTYYGLSFFDPPELFEASGNSGQMISWIISFLIEFPAYVASGWAMEQPAIGRKGVGGGCLAIAAAVLGIAALKPMSPEWMDGIYTACYYVARMFISAAFAVVYVWSAELFPNSIRNTCMGINLACGTFGSAMSPWIDEINNFTVKMLCFAIPGSIAGVLGMLKLPETLGKALPGYIADLED